MRSYKHIKVNATDCQSSCCLRVEHLGVSFGSDEILKDVGFHLHCGELTALIGPNGAGKSSLIKSILGQMPHTGTIRFHTAEGARFQPRIGYVPQSPSFDKGDPVSVLDLFVCSISRYPVWLPIPRSLREQVRACLARVHGEELIDKRVGMLSGGELQRVLLAMALAGGSGTASAEAFDSVLGDTASCHRACQLTYPLHTYPKVGPVRTGLQPFPGRPSFRSPAPLSFLGA